MTTKLGPHVQQHTTGDALAWAARGPIAKQMNGTGLLAAAHPNAIQIYRRFFDNQEIPEDDAALDARAREVADAILAGLAGYRHPNLYAEVFNEVPGSMWRRYARLLVRVVAILHAAGVKVAGPCWATGDYEAEAWEGFRALSWCGLDLIAVHAYWSTAGFTVWNALRWRLFWKPGDPPLVVTECGRDRVRDGNPNVDEGWLPRKDGDAFGYVAQGVSEDAFLAELEAYDAEIGKDAHVWGATPFTCGPTDDWKAKGFDVDPLARRLADRSTPRTSPPVVVVQPPTVVPPVVKPPAPKPKPPEIALKKITLGGVEFIDLRDRYPYAPGKEYPIRALSSIDTVVQHHTASPLPADSIEAEIAVFDSAHSWHVNHHGWPAIGYHVGVGRGRLYLLNGLELESYHARVANRTGIGMVWPGDFTNGAPPAAFVKSSGVAYRALQTHLGRPLRLVGHYEVTGPSDTSCPGMGHWPTTKQTILKGGAMPTPMKPDPVDDALNGMAHHLNDADGRARAYYDEVVAAARRSRDAQLASLDKVRGEMAELKKALGKQ